MAKINNLAIAKAVVSNPNISIQNAFFGLVQRVVYTPTQSPVDIITEEYTPEQGERLRRLLSLSPAKMSEELSKGQKPQSTSVGPYRLEVCLSRDRRFAAMQLFRYAGIDFESVSDYRCLVGEEAAVIAQLF